ncbi:piggyBac transposable element-derived protein 4 [Bombyx mori]|uniref:piggyBac transposable element-derived protein 4 n=1 Tax=Bombyx mori TaxID=7091 RepID=UPI002ED4FDA0
MEVGGIVPSHALMPSSSNSPVPDDEINASLINYGSETESDEEEVGIGQSLVVPRVVRMLMDEDEEDEENGLNVSLEWPTQSSICTSKPASPMLPTPTPVSPTPMEPSNKFKFVWRAVSMPQIEPHLRREPFSQINSGPTVSFASPYEAFIAIWDREIMEVIVRETNIYAQKLATAMLENGTIYPNSRITHWQDTNVNELYTYFAIVLAMGKVVKSRLEEYWSTSQDIFSTPCFSTEMTHDRFLLLSKCLHFNSNNDCDPALLTRHQINLLKIKPLIDHLNNNFSELYNLSQNLVIDESLTTWKGWLDINQSFPNEAATAEIKAYELCESQSGYLWRFELHAGLDTSTPQDNPISGTVPALVLRLLDGLEHKGHTIWMDSFFNSPALARELKVRGFDCVGTLRTNRQFVPYDLTRLTIKDLTVGQVLGCTSGDVDLMVWRDRKRAAFISTYHGLASTRFREKLKPTVVHDYSLCMDRLDRRDRLLATFPIERRTKAWSKKFFRRLLNISVLNSYILLQNQSLLHRNFRNALVTDLLTAHRTPKPNTTTIATQVHYPAQYPLIKRGKSDRLRRQCAVCPKRTVSYCKACNVAMCTYTCYETYHTSH